MPLLYASLCKNATLWCNTTYDSGNHPPIYDHDDALAAYYFLHPSSFRYNKQKTNKV